MEILQRMYGSLTILPPTCSERHDKEFCLSFLLLSFAASHKCGFSYSWIILSFRGEAEPGGGGDNGVAPYPKSASDEGTAFLLTSFDWRL